MRSFARRSAGRLVAVLLAAAGARPLAAQQPPTASDRSPVFRSGAAVVLLDLVVRDKKGRSVLDLGRDELEVFEDGVRCEIAGFRRISGEALSLAATGTSETETVDDPRSAEAPDTRRISFVTPLFDPLGPNGRTLARKAALKLLDSPLRNSVWISVFVLDESLSLVQPFTGDRAAIREAVRSATSGARRGAIEDSGEYGKALLELERASARAEAASVANQARAQGGAAAAGHAGAAAQVAQARALVNMLRMSKDLQRQQQGETSLYPLLALMKGHSTLEGRKTLLYFSEGLAVPPSLESVFRAAIGEANRANVSVYAVDARGLDASSQNEEAKQALEDAVAATRRAMERQGGAVEIDEILAAETAESALRLNVQGTLSDLSESTGGFLMANTNDFRQGMERLATDVSAYYEVAYVPPPRSYDGKFRAVSVKLRRKGLQVQTRSGYFALPPEGAAILLPYEVPLYAALESPTPVHGFECRAAALRFGSDGAQRDHVLMLEVPLRNLTFEIDEAKQTYGLRFSVLALIKDEQGRVVERFSEDYPFEGSIEKVEGLKLGNVVFKRAFQLPPGRYTLETVAADAAAVASATRLSFEVPQESEPALSSLSVIRRLEPAPQAGSDDPFALDRVRIVPNLDAPISAGTNPSLSLFFTVHPKAGAEPPTMLLEFSREGKVVGRAVPELPAPDAKGRIPYVGTFPIKTFSPGRYELRAAVQQGTVKAEERASFTIVP